MERKEEWARQIRQAELDGAKIAMFHYIVLSNAHQLKHVNPKQFTADVGLKESFHTEFSKMIALAKLMDRIGVALPK